MSKDVTMNEDHLVFQFKNEVSAFGGLKKANIEHLAYLNNHISANIFKYLSDRGIPSHFIECIDETSQMVTRVKMIPLEVIIRNKAVGPWMETLGLSYESELTQPILEYRYKSNQLHDPLINTTHILAMNMCSEDEIKRIKELSLKINELLSNHFKELFMELIDLKLEFGKNSAGEILLADSITPGTMRIRDCISGDSLDKDVFRKDLGKLDMAYEIVLSRLEGKA